MYRDKSLQPLETIRLLALGLLAEGARDYDDLAREIRRFTARIVGPNLDLLGSSLEILRLEGWAHYQASGNKILVISDSGQAMLKDLLATQVRTPLNDVNRLALLTKLRFLRHLSKAEQTEQLSLLEELVIREQAWAADLQQDYQASALHDWLAMELELQQARLAWLQAQVKLLHTA